MNESDSPVLRLIPYLLAITAAIVGCLFVIDVSGDLLFGLLSAAALYFGGFYLSRSVINHFAGDGRTGDDHGGHDDAS